MQPEEVSRKRKRYYPQCRTDEVVGEKCAVGHAAHSRHKGGKGADNRDETGNYNGFCAIFFIEIMGFFEVFGFQPSGFFGKEQMSEPRADAIVKRVADNCGNYQENYHRGNVERAEGA